MKRFQVDYIEINEKKEKWINSGSLIINCIFYAVIFLTKLDGIDYSDALSRDYIIIKAICQHHHQGQHD